MEFESEDWDIGQEASELDRSLFHARNENNKQDGATTKTTQKRKHKDWSELPAEQNITKKLKTAAVESDRPDHNAQNKDLPSSKQTEAVLNRKERRQLNWEKKLAKKKLQAKLYGPTEENFSNNELDVGGKQTDNSEKKIVAEVIEAKGMSVLTRKERRKMKSKQKMLEKKQKKKDKLSEAGVSVVRSKKDENLDNIEISELSETNRNVSNQKMKQKKRKDKLSVSHSNINKLEEDLSPSKKLKVNIENDTVSPQLKKKRKRPCKKNKFKGYIKPESGDLEQKTDTGLDDRAQNLQSNTCGPDETDIGHSLNDDSAFSLVKKKKKSRRNKQDSSNKKSEEYMDHSVNSEISFTMLKKQNKIEKKNQKSSNEIQNNAKQAGLDNSVDTEYSFGLTKTKSDTHNKLESAMKATDANDNITKPNSSVKGKNYSRKHALDRKFLSNLLKAKNDKTTGNIDSVAVDNDNAVVDSKQQKKSLLEKSWDRLNAARFRYLNEQLYTSTGQEALNMFSNDKRAFQVYHEGFQGQVEKWPTNPIDKIIEQIKTKPKHLVLADFGCGDAKLARSVQNTVHSFDLVALNDKVTVCDMSKVPLKDNTVDIAVFCLSLMGTNLSAYLNEANRVLKNNGTLLIAEVTSRFQSIGSFVLQVEKMGFKIKQQDTENKMFVMMEFKKTSRTKVSLQDDLQLKPCVYKKR